ncbi:hypothetical protein BDV96DRAFT_694259 [Lophiotrema nucula]|uniref:Uncharacterized protein n=1 Tax=Lophiotrema nucula TaxID=690887 RepID=A0A6A5YJ97_9PLEO|nr:hypothetical protein BDV96DRAFT_694259 [Lophiotrema nucula]
MAVLVTKCQVAIGIGGQSWNIILAHGMTPREQPLVQLVVSGSLMLGWFTEWWAMQSIGSTWHSEAAGEDSSRKER